MEFILPEYSHIQTYVNVIIIILEIYYLDLLICLENWF